MIYNIIYIYTYVSIYISYIYNKYVIIQYPLTPVMMTKIRKKTLFQLRSLAAPL